MYTYEPPDVGIAVAISDFEKLGKSSCSQGRITKHLLRIQRYRGCSLSLRSAGSTKSPDPSIADSEIMITPISQSISNGAE